MSAALREGARFAFYDAAHPPRMLPDLADVAEREAKLAAIAREEAWLAAGLLTFDTFREVLGIVANFEREAQARARVARHVGARIEATFRRPSRLSLGSIATRARFHYDRAGRAVAAATSSAAEARAVLTLVVERATILRFLPLEGEIK